MSTQLVMVYEAKYLELKSGQILKMGKKFRLKPPLNRPDSLDRGRVLCEQLQGDKQAVTM